ncbi:IS5 family transposase [Dellaglioa algida]|nr:IS5 family transposase [Dellaglioa algida]
MVATLDEMMLMKISDQSRKENFGNLAVDNNGPPRAIHITTANVSDCAGASDMLAINSDHLDQVTSVLVDGGYIGSNFESDVKINIKATVQVAKRNELHKFEVLPQRWIIEQSFSWLDKCRRLWRNCERQLNTSLQMIVLAFLTLLIQR